MPKFDVTVKLSGTDGNAFAIIGKVSSGIRKAGGTSEDVNEFHKEATGGDYNNVLTTCFKWVNVE